MAALYSRSRLPQLTYATISYRNIARQITNGAEVIHWSPTDRTVMKTKYDYVVVGAGHNGLVAANYLAKAGKSVCVLERRHCVGGASVTEEIVPGFQFSRCSYLLSLFRPNIMKDLKLKEQGLKLFFREPFSYTPLLEHERTGSGRSLFLYRDQRKNYESIAQFSVKDAEVYHQYEAYLDRILKLVDTIIDEPPINVDFYGKKGKAKAITSALFKGMEHSKLFFNTNWKEVVELFSAPASKILSRWFESDILKGTLATDSVIGAMLSPHSPGSAYVLLHHVMGEIDGMKGAWCYVQGGMGSLTKILARSAQDLGVHVFTDSNVDQIVTRASTEDRTAHCVQGVLLKNGVFMEADKVLSNATPFITLKQLCDKNSIPKNVLKEIEQMDYTSPVTKINVAVDRIPNFSADPSHGKVQPCHFGSIHLNSCSVDSLHTAFMEANQGRFSTRPMIDMTIPSALDDSLVDHSKYPNGHVVQLFTQYTPKELNDTQNGGALRPWTEEDRKVYAQRVFDCIEEYAPGFKQSIVGYDMLTPADLESIFGLTGGNIFHGSLCMDQLYFLRPTSSQRGYETAVKNLFLCGAGTHPGGGVMGACGKLAAEEALRS